MLNCNLLKHYPRVCMVLRLLLLEHNYCYGRLLLIYIDVYTSKWLYLYIKFPGQSSKLQKLFYK